MSPVPQKMAGDLLTVSLGSWMELPGLGFQQWCLDNDRSRARVTDVARYYADYVQTMGVSYLIQGLSHSRHRFT